MKQKVISRQNLILIALSGLQLFSMANSNFAVADSLAPQLRGLSLNPIAIQNNSADKQNIEVNRVPLNYKKSASSKTLNGSISELYGIVGKTKLIRFDVPVKRISITNPDLADLILLSPKEMLLNGKAAGATSFIIWGETGNPKFFDLVVANDSKEFLKAVNDIAPTENIDFNFTNTGVVMTGKISSTSLRDKIKGLADAYGFKLTDLSETTTNQVMLEVKVVEASKSLTRDLSSTFSRGGLADDMLTDAGVAVTDASKTFDFDGTLNGFRFLKYWGKNNTAMVLKAAEQNGTAQILAEPTIVTTEGNEASFNAGQEVPIPSGVSESGEVSYEYKKVGVNVSFKPTILENSRRVMLKITPEVSEIDYSSAVSQATGGVGASFKTRSVNTTVELADNETLIIAGLYKKTNNQTRAQIPMLGNIPVLGLFFKNSEVKKDETELMIFVTPKILDNKTTDRI